MSTHPKRTFDPMIPRHQGGRPIADCEDEELTAYLEGLISDALSADETPPACPHCGSRATRIIKRAHAAADGRPGFQCWACRKYFKRNTGTPLSGLARKELLPAFVRLLSQQKSFLCVAEELGANYRLVARWTRLFRAWLLELDPSGHYEAKVRLGIPPPLDALACPSCDANGTLVHHGFGSKRRGDAADRRQLRCSTCRAFVLVPEGKGAAIIYPAKVQGRDNGRHAELRPRRKPVGPLEPEIVARAAAGETYRAIARAMGLHEATVSKVVRHHHAVARGEAVTPRRPPGRRPHEVPGHVQVEIRCRRDAGESLNVIQKALGLSYTQVTKILAQAEPDKGPD